MNKDLKSGFFFTAIAQYGNMLGQLTINIILSHLLKPTDFGIVTFVQIFAIFFNTVVSATIPTAIIQNKKLTEKDYGVVFNYTALIGLVIALIFGGLGYVFASFMHNPIYIPVTWCMALLVVIDGLDGVPQGIMLKEKRFKAIAVRQILAVLLGAIFGISAAFLGAGLYALILVLVIPQIVFLIFSMLSTKIAYTTSFDPRSIKKVIGFIGYQSNFSIVNYFYRNLDNLLVGKVLGSQALGYYSKSYQLLNYPVGLFLGVINPVLQPVLSDFERDVAYIRDTYLKLSEILALIAVPLSVFMILNAGDIIYLLFGPQWTAAIHPLSILSYSIWAQMLAQMMPSIWQSRNLSRLQMRNGFISFIVIASAIVLGILTGQLNLVALAVSLSYILNFFISGSLLMHFGLEGQIRQLLKILIKPALIGLVTALVLHFAQPSLQFDNHFLNLLTHGLLWAIVLFLSLLITGDLKKIRQLLKK